MAEKVKDLICGMEFEEKAATGRIAYWDKMNYFCSSGCLEKFLQNPENYVAHEMK